MGRALAASPSMVRQWASVMLIDFPCVNVQPSNSTCFDVRDRCGFCAQARSLPMRTSN